MFREKLMVHPYSPRGGGGRQYRGGTVGRSTTRSRGFMFNLLWMAAYLCITIVALLVFSVVPEILSMRHPNPAGRVPVVELSQVQVDLGRQSQLSLLSSHHLRSTKVTLQTEEEEEEEKLWSPPADKGFVPCTKPNSKYQDRKPISRGYLVVSANGGLNQMRAGICDMVAVARMINATLVIPELDHASFWHDASNFSDVFDLDHFIKSLSNDVPVIKKLPLAFRRGPKIVKQFKSWSNARYYEEDIGHLWNQTKVIKAAKTDSRLANNHLPSEIQKLRCRVHYEALRFAPHIEALGKVLVDRMRAAGPFIALHLRYEKDMLAFSGCTHGLSKQESDELYHLRDRTHHWKRKKINATEQRNKGFCPLTPKEVGIFLKSLGFAETTRVYIAAGEIYGGRKRMAGLLSRFPHVMSKEAIATAEELAPYKHHASQMAALDYIVSVESDVFVPSFSGNMARAVEGHRRYLGHRKTIIPDRKSLVRLFDRLENGTLHENEKLAEVITAMHQDRQGAPRRRRGPMQGTRGRDRYRSEEAFYTNPAPDCLCQQNDQPVHITSSPRRVGHMGSRLATQRRF